MALWPNMAPGGLYFVEDLHVSRWPRYASVDPSIPDLVFTDHVHSWNEQLITGSRKHIKGGSTIPDGVRFITCTWYVDGSTPSSSFAPSCLTGGIAHNFIFLHS